MAKRYPIAPQVVDPVEHQINETFDRLIILLNVRRDELLDIVREKRTTESLRKEIIDQLIEVQEPFHLDLREDTLQPLKNRMIRKLECKKREMIINTPVESRFELKCDTREIETRISRHGEIVEVPVNVPRYGTCQTSIAATGKRGSASGELDYPYGVAIHEETHHIFVANDDNHRVEIFSETGEFISQLGVGKLSEPSDIAIYGDSVYVSSDGDHTVNKFSLTEMCRVRRIGGKGSNNGQFKHPRHLTTDPTGLVLIADDGNDRICIYDPDLNHLRNIMHPSMSRPYDVKVSRDRLYVLCPYNNPCMHVLTLEGDKLHSLITCGEGMDVEFSFFFCMDPLKNFVISDCDSHSIRVFSPEGNRLHTIGEEEDQEVMFEYPMGVAITPNGRLICVSWNWNGLQIFY